MGSGFWTGGSFLPLRSLLSLPPPQPRALFPFCRIAATCFSFSGRDFEAGGEGEGEGECECECECECEFGFGFCIISHGIKGFGFLGDTILFPLGSTDSRLQGSNQRQKWEYLSRKEGRFGVGSLRLDK